MGRKKKETQMDDAMLENEGVQRKSLENAQSDDDHAAENTSMQFNEMKDEDINTDDDDEIKSNDDGMKTDSVIMQMLKQQQLLIEALIKSNNNGDGNKSGASMHVMPDLSKGISKFNGEKGSHEAKYWLKEIKSKKALHFWTDEICLQLAQTHLTDGAKNWFRANQSEIGNSWVEFEHRFKKTFVGKETRADKFKRMLERKQLKDENVYTYCFDKFRLSQEAKMEFIETKAELVIGFRTRDLSQFIAARNHNDFDELIEDVRCYDKTIRRRKENFSNNGAKDEDKGNSKENSSGKGGNKHDSQDKKERCFKCGRRGHCSKDCKEDQPKCFNCNQFGHISKDCTNPKTVVKCYECKLEGHVSRECPDKKKDDPNKHNRVKQHLINVGKEQVNNQDKYIKDCFVNDSKVEGLIDCGSSSCTMMKSVAENLGLKYERYVTEIFGFGNINKPVTYSIGQIPINLKIDDFSGPTDLLIVPDGVQPASLMVGRSWTELPDIALIKKDNTLYFGHKDAFPFKDIDMFQFNSKVELRANENITLQPHMVNWIRVQANVQNADVLTDEGVLITIKDGETLLPITSFGKESGELHKGVKKRNTRNKYFKLLRLRQLTN